MNLIPTQLKQVLEQIRQAELDSGRQQGVVRLLAVTKTKPAADIALAYHAGQRHFGESYLQEALIKQKQLGSFNITWHFIGPIQSNKTRLIASRFSWVHSVDRLKIAKRLSEQRPGLLPPLNICLQVNISGEPSKSGVSPDEFSGLAEQVMSLPRLKLRGVMAIPSPQNDFQLQRASYRKLYQSIVKLDLPGLDTFSLGMSGDLDAAIAEGSTLVRVGTAIFGVREIIGDRPRL